MEKEPCVKQSIQIYSGVGFHNFTETLQTAKENGSEFMVHAWNLDHKQ